MDRNFTILIALLIICVSAGAFQGCQNEHELKMKCVEKGLQFRPSGQCKSGEEK